LGRVLADSFRSAAERLRHSLPPWGRESDTSILKILLEQGAFFEERETEVQGVRALGLLARSDVRDFLLVNASGGTEWFNKERFEALIRLLFLTKAAVAPAGKSGERLTGIIRLYRAAGKLIDDAERAGYRTEAFLTLSCSE
jgi:hypothetical protein